MPHTRAHTHIHAAAQISFCSCQLVEAVGLTNLTSTQGQIFMCASSIKVTKINVCLSTTKLRGQPKKRRSWGRMSHPQNTLNIFTTHQEVLNDRSFRPTSIHTLP